MKFRNNWAPILYPPTPAFAKAGAAPGTTGGVELGSRVASKGTRRLPAPALSFYGGSSLPSASPQNPPNASLQLPCRLPAPALSFYGGSSLPSASPQNPQMLPCSSHAVCQPRHCPFMVVQACRLPARKTPKCFPAAPMPFASPGIVLLCWFKPAVCQPAKPPKCFPAAPMPFASPGIVLLCWFKPAVCPPAKPPKCFPAAPMPFASPGIVLFWWFKPAVCQPAKPPKCFPAAPMPFASPGIVLLWWFKPAVCEPAKPPKCFPAAPHAVCQPRHCPFMVVQA